MRFTKYLEITLFVIIGAFFFSFSFKSFEYLFFNKDTTTLTQGMFSAFGGAFFAFLFVRLSDFFNKTYERSVKNYNALVRLEILFNSNFDIIYHNLFVIKEFREAYNKTRQEKRIVAVMQRFRLFTVSDEAILNLLDINLINQLFGFLIDTKKLNNDLEMVNLFYNDLKQNCIETKALTTYEENMQEIANSFATLEKFIKNFETENFNILATARVLQKDKPLLSRIIFSILKPKRASSLLKKIEKEKIVLKTEMDVISAQSKKEVENILTNK